MAGFDDEMRGSDVAPGTIELAGSSDGRKRHARSLRETQLRLVRGGQVLGQTHGHRINQKRFTVKTNPGSNVVITNFGYNCRMGKIAPDIRMRREALRRLIGDEPLRPWSIRAGIAYTTFLRLCEGENPPKIAEFDKLLSLKGYPELLASIRQEHRRAISAGAEESIARILDVLGEAGIDSLAFTVEGMSRIVGNEHVVENLRERLSDVQKLARQMADSEKETRKSVR